MKKKHGLGLSLLLGAVLGYVISLFVSEKTTKKHRAQLTQSTHKVLDQFLSKKQKKALLDSLGETSQKTGDLLNQIHTTLSANLDKASNTWSQIDKQKYTKAVEATIKSLRNQGELNSRQLKQLGQYLVEDFEHFRNQQEQKT